MKSQRDYQLLFGNLGCRIALSMTKDAEDKGLITPGKVSNTILVETLLFSPYKPIMSSYSNFILEVEFS